METDGKTPYKELLKQYAQEVFPRGGRGAAADEAGREAERRILRILRKVVGGVPILQHRFIVDENEQCTNHKVDVCLCDASSSQVTQRQPIARVHTIRVALEIKLSFEDFDDARRQLASIKTLTRYRAMPPQTVPDAPTPRGNLFCGAFFAYDSVSQPSLLRLWRTRIRKLLKQWPDLFAAHTAMPCDSGRYPNFFWGWEKYIVLKCYRVGDFKHPRPNQYHWEKLVEFQAPSPWTGKPEDVEYWLGLARSTASPILKFFTYRFLKECHLFEKDIPEFSGFESYVDSG